MSGDVWIICALTALFIVGCSVAFVCGFAYRGEIETDRQPERDAMRAAAERNAR